MLVELGHAHLNEPIAERAPRWPAAFSGVTAHQYSPGSRLPWGANAVPEVSIGPLVLPTTGVASAGSAAIVTTYLNACGTGSQRSTSGTDGYCTVAPSAGANSRGRCDHLFENDRVRDQRPASPSAVSARTRQS